jgi:signal transduction histidine kinase
MRLGRPDSAAHNASPPGPVLLRYCAAIALTVAVSLAARELGPWYDLVDRHPYLIEWPTVIAAGWFGGLGPGLVAATVSSFAILFYWVKPGSTGIPVHSSDLVGIALFASCGVVFSVLIESLHRARRREHDLRRARELVLGVVAHDLRNPLNTIRFATTLLRSKPDTLRQLDLIERAVRRMDHLIRDLVDASRLEADETLAIASAPETLALLVEEAVTAATLNATVKSVSITTELAPGLRIHCDRERFLQVLSNLLDNAVKFTPEGGRVAARTARVGALARVEVTDSGPGIQAEQQADVFKRHWTGRVAGSGAGLGLFIAQGIVRAHGGRVWLHSEPGHGTTFFVTLPALDEAKATAIEPAGRDSERFRFS